MKPSQVEATLQRPNRYPSDTRSIYLTNVNGEDGENVMVFTTLTADELAAALRQTNKVTFDEHYEVPEKDAAFYLYEPCWLTLTEEARARELLTAA